MSSACDSGSLSLVSWLGIAELTSDERRVALRDALRAADVAEADAVVRALEPLIRLPIVRLAGRRIIVHLARAGSPRRAALCLAEAVRTLEDTRGDASPLFVEPILDVMLKLAGSSASAARLLAADPTLAIELGTQNPKVVRDGQVNFQKALKKVVTAAAGDTPTFDRLLRRYRNRQMLRLALLELREADVRDTAASLADFASAALDAALSHHRAILETQVGRPDPECAFVVMGMGKLGGRELNYSSDIDVIYFYEHDHGAAGDLSMHEFHVRLFERVTASLSRITEHGLVFRVDLDLRPEGRQGALANSLASAERYYETWGRTWERAAWVRARPVAGDRALGQRLLSALRPFVYRRSFDLAAIEDILQMKTQIDADLQTRRPARLRTGRDLKLGPGGIREIEFFVQALQLLYGGRDSRLRVTNTLDALQSLEAAGRITRRTRTRLGDAYMFLRKVEHRVQLVDEQQTHSLPADSEAIEHLARSLRLSDAAALHAAVDRHMQSAHEVFSGLLGQAEEDEPLPEDIARLADAGLADETRAEVLARLGAVDPVAALANLKTVERIAASPLHPRADRTRRSVGVQLLWACCESPDLDRALTHLPDLVKALLAHGTYLQQLEDPTRRRGVSRLMGASTLLARILVSHPGLVPQVILATPLLATETLEHILAERIGSCGDDVELALGTLRNVKHEEVLRTAVAELGDAIAAPAVHRRLSHLSEMLLAAALRLAVDEQTKKFGPPKDDRAALVILAGGTLGAREMGYRSDVDLSVVYRGEGDTRGGYRPAITTQEFYTRVVQRLLAFLTIRMPQGDLYPVDMRLRPSGRQGALVVSLANFRTYHEGTARLWERQALLRTRTIAGAPDMRREVDAAITAAAYDAPVPVDAARQIHEMRVRMTKERSEIRNRRSDERPLDLKFGRGSLIEIEFMVQYLLLRHGRDNPRIRSTNTHEALRAFVDESVISAADAEHLIMANDRWRRVQNWLRVAQDRMTDFVDLDRIRSLALAVGYHGANAQQLLTRDLLRDAELINRAYRRVLAV